MKMRSRLLIAGTLAALVAGPAVADLGYNPGSVATIFDFICFTTKHCSAHVPVNSAGTEIGTGANPIRTDPTGSTIQPVSAASLPLPAGAATSANQTTINTSVGTTNTNLGALADSVWVSGSGSLIAIAKTAANHTYWAGGTLGAMANYGSSPGAVLVPGVNAFVTNSNANGQTTMANSSPIVIASNQTQLPVDTIVTPSNSFTRPANTTAYASGQLVANSTTAGSVVPLSWTSAARVSGGNFYIRRVRVTLSSKSVTLTSFRVHFYTVTPTIANGDGAAWSTTLANYVCKMDVPVASWEAGTDVSIGFGLPTSGDGNECNVVASTQTLFALVEARAAYVPASGETVTVIPEIHQN